MPLSTSYRLAGLAATATIALVVFGLPNVEASSVTSSTTYYVSTTGSDSAAGTSVSTPFRTIGKAIFRLKAGDSLVVRGGTYTEKVTGRVLPGTATAPIRVSAYPNERPVLQGLLWLNGPSYWTIDGLNVTWGSASKSDHMVKMTDGVGWRITNAEIWGAHSYAALLVAGSPSNWRLDHLYVHDTYKSNGTNQDHLIYVSASGAGTIENCVLANSANGRGVKVGGSGSSSLGPVTIRYNTFYANLGPSNIQLSYRASNTQIYRNIMQKSSEAAVTVFKLSGSGNVAHDNVAWEADSVSEPGSGFTDTGGETLTDPKFRDPAHGDFRPTNNAVSSYGAYATG